ncbi:MAG TPA: tetratricopeptide repeat protein [Xanthobacteraceae bacterium]|nr:tetratricopeptide repeat protein [Xanthobacteraceae bacterium]
MAGKSILAMMIELGPRAHRLACRARRSGMMGLAVAGLIAAAPLAGDGAKARAAAQANVTATVANGFARLVLTLPEDVRAEVKRANGIIVIAFTQPLDVSVDRVPASVQGYIAAARRDPDGMAVRFALARKVTINSMTAGEKLFVDLLPEGWTGLPPGLPQEVVDELARRAREAEKKARAQQPQKKPEVIARVRVATLPTLTRYVFELPQAIAVSVDRDKAKLSVIFDAPLTLDLADVKTAMPPTVTDVDAEKRTNSVALRFTLAGNVDVRTFREEGTFVLDLIPTSSGDRAANATDASRQQSKIPQKPDAGRAASQPPSANPSAPEATPPAVEPQSRVAIASPAAPAVAPVPPVQPPITDEKAAPKIERAAVPAAQPNGAAAEKKGVPKTETAGVDPTTPAKASAKLQDDTLQLTFPFRTRTAAAVFRRADMLYLVFDSATSLDINRMKEEAQGIIRDVVLMRTGEGQVLRLTLDRSRLASVTADDKAWVVTLGDAVLEPTAPLRMVQGRAGTDQALALIPLQEPQKVHRLRAPEGDGGLVVITAHAPARGFVKEQEFVDFRVLASSHGVAFEPMADDVAAEVAPEGITISRPGGLALTPAAQAGSAPPPALPSPPVALDLRAWEQDRNADFQDRRMALMHAAAEAPEGERTPARVKFARFYLARDMFAEAKGLLDVALAQEEDHSQRAMALMLRGIANLLMTRADLALRDFATPIVGAQQGAPLWRAVALSRLNRFAEARPGFETLEAEMPELPDDLQRTVLREAARCALEVGDFSQAARRLEQLEAAGVENDMEPAVAILSGRLAEGLNRSEQALAAYDLAAVSGDAPAAAQGRLRALALRHALKQIPREAAIAELESLTAGWRGDETEIEALQLLARLYVEESQYREAFHILRVVLNAYPRSRFTRRIQDEAAGVFDGIFLGDRGQDLSPVEALGLFYDFRMLIPSGRRGDDMIRALADRLVAMDLLAQASELLQHQIEHRLQGAARAQAGARLATISLTNRKPDKALQVLRATRLNDLVSDVRRQRLLLEARALSELGRHELALEIIEALEGREVARLRADIRWTARQWREAAEEIERLLGDRWRNAAPLEADERTDVIRAAIGYALAEDSLGLDRFHQKYAAKMAEGPDARMFEVIAAPQIAQAPELTEIAKAASAIDTLEAFLRDLRARYPGPAAVSAVPQPGRG